MHYNEQLTACQSSMLDPLHSTLHVVLACTVILKQSADSCIRVQGISFTRLILCDTTDNLDYGHVV